MSARQLHAIIFKMTGKILYQTKKETLLLSTHFVILTHPLRGTEAKIAFLYCRIMEITE